MILDEIAAATKERVKKAKADVSLEAIKKIAQSLPQGNFPFERALAHKEMTFICEIKRCSPSKGLLAEEFPYLEIAKAYEDAGAGAISVLTEPDFFLGSNKYLTAVKNQVSLPVLRKDFTIDEYQIYEAKTIGADAILLIVSLLEKETLKEYLKISRHLGLSALVEAHTKEEVETALAAGAPIIGVNNRNLKTFEVNIETSIRLRSMVPKGIFYIAESGIKSPEDIVRLRQCGADGVLIGETLMKSADKKSTLKKLRGNSDEN